jgi:hypothetical protein
VAVTILGFFLGWLIFGILLADFYKSNTVEYTGLMKDPPSLWTFAVANLCLAVLFVLIFRMWAGITTFLRGLNAGIIITLLVMLSFDLFMYGSMNLFSFRLVIVDVIANTVLGGLMGGLAGLILGMGKEKAGATV